MQIYERKSYMKHIYTIDEIKEKLNPVFQSLPIETAFIFGSYAKGAAAEGSDIDILIDSKGSIKGIDFLVFSKK